MQVDDERVLVGLFAFQMACWNFHYGFSMAGNVLQVRCGSRLVRGNNVVMEPEPYISRGAAAFSRVGFIIAYGNQVEILLVGEQGDGITVALRVW